MKIQSSHIPLNQAIRAVLLGLSMSGAVLPLCAQAQQAADAQQMQSWDIPAGPLAAALDSYARQSGINLAYDTATLAGKRTAGVSGTYDRHQALELLLRGSGLKAQPQASNSLLLVPQSRDGDALDLGAIDITGQAMGGVTEGTGSYTTGAVSIGKTPQSLRRTPQSVTVLTEQRLKDQNLTNLTEVLYQTPGVVVDYTDSERVTYYSRGYQIDAIQFDGATIYQNIGGGNFIQPDAATLDHVEILRGASGMQRGAGNPSGTVNMVRKRPTREFQGSASYTVGSWEANRYVADLSGPLAEGGAIRGRIIAVHDDKDFFQDTRMERKSVLYTVLAADLGESTTVTGGLEYTELDATGAWGNLVANQDGSPMDLSRDTFLGANWARWDRTNLHMFVELEHQLQNDWNLTLNASRSRFAYKDHGFQQSFLSRDANNPDLFNLSATNSDDGGETFTDNLRAVAAGPFRLFGREHQLTVGAERNRIDYTGITSAFGNVLEGLTDSDIRNWNPSAIPKPAFAITNPADTSLTTQEAVYATGSFSLTDPLTAIIGARLNWWDTETFSGFNKSVSEYSVDREIVPYAALVYDLTDHISAYGSYTEIFAPQNARDSSDSILDPMTGEVYELGLKGEFYEGRLNSSIAIFRANLVGKALSDTSGPNPCYPGATGYCQIAAGKSRSEGFEVELSGEIMPGWQASGGYTYTTTEFLKDTTSNQGNPLRTTDPKHQLKLFTSYNLPGAYSAWTVGGGVQAQSDIYATSGAAHAEQGGYAIYNAMLGYRFNEHYSLQFNANNLTDKYYYKKIGASGVSYYYGDPRNFALALRGEF